MEKTKFAQGLSFYKLFIIFMIGSVIGSVYEELYTFIRCFLRDGSIVWSLRQGVIYGPFNIIYGFGAVIMIVCLYPKKDNWKNVLISGSLLGGLVEYIFSFLQETFTGTVSWDYAGKFLNINGRTTIPYMLFWGLCGLFVVYKFYPFISKKIEEVPIKTGTIITKFLVVFMTVNMLVSFTAVIRQSLRRSGYPAYTFIGRICDQFYTDEFLSKYYPNMKKVEG